MNNQKTPTEICQECGKERPAYNFTSLLIKESEVAKVLCSKCYNRYFTSANGLDDLEITEFGPTIITDSSGKDHVFHFDVRLTTGLGIEAFELIDGDPGGYMFSVLVHPETPVHEAYVKLIGKIKNGLSIKYLELSDFGYGQKKMYLKHSAVNGRIEEKDDSPIAVVDGIEYGWDELGRCLSSHMRIPIQLTTDSDSN
ncbi:MAG TPA: hypothetical protein VNJ08_12270 [Bacteriovoracaceae bacterium]|nr:hypothetical protein [Bacteriovoracaceae bacterium]